MIMEQNGETLHDKIHDKWNLHEDAIVWFMN